jgi:hypothetical protein
MVLGRPQRRTRCKAAKGTARAPKPNQPIALIALPRSRNLRCAPKVAVCQRTYATIINLYIAITNVFWREPSAADRRGRH